MPADEEAGRRHEFDVAATEAVWIDHGQQVEGEGGGKESQGIALPGHTLVSHLVEDMAEGQDQDGDDQTVRDDAVFEIDKGQGQEDG